MAGEADVFILLFLALLFPPAAVAFVAGCSADLCLNILLTLLGYLPGCIHAFWLILRRAEANERYGYRNWTYTGMGEYYPRDRAPPGVVPYGPPPPPPPPAPMPAAEQFSTSKPPPQSEAPVEQKQSGYTPAEGKSSGYPGPPLQPPPDELSGYVPPLMPVDQKQQGSSGAT